MVQVSNILVPDAVDPHGNWKICKANIRNCSSTQIKTMHSKSCIYFKLTRKLIFLLLKKIVVEIKFIEILYKLFSEFRLKFLHALRGLGSSKSNGMFIDSCYVHCQTERQEIWFRNDSTLVWNKVSNY